MLSIYKWNTPEFPRLFKKREKRNERKIKKEFVWALWTNDHFSVHRSLGMIPGFRMNSERKCDGKEKKKR